MAQKLNLEGMIDSSPIMQDFADIETGNLPEYTIDSKIPEGPIAEKWTNYKAHQHLVNPANKRNLDIIVVGTGLAGASAASTLGEMGFNVYNFCIQDSPRRAHSIAAQGGINAAKNYQATSAHAKPTCTVLPKFPTTSSTSACSRAFPSPANTAASSPTVLSAALR